MAVSLHPSPREKLGVLGSHVRRRSRELEGVVAERADARFHVRVAIVVHRVLGQLVGCALGTEVVGMRAQSVVAVVGSRDDHGK